MHDAPHNRVGTPKSLAGMTGQTATADFIPQAGEDFVATPSIVELTNRALSYISVGYAVHLSGPAGTGKTTLALHIASQIGRRCTLLHGDDELRGSDLLGRDSGYRRQSVRDNYVSSILKTEETVSVMWSSNRLTTACEQGHTVIYDEFTRSPAAANNAFLSILEEGILSIPSSSQEKSYVRVHPDFRAIFTSNPEEYVGVHKSQDALLDRMITLEVSHQDRETEIAIVKAKSQRTVEEATAIVEIIRAMRERLGSKNGPTIRAALAIAKISDHRKSAVASSDPNFMTTCQDVLYYNASRQSPKPFTRDDLNALIASVLITPRNKITIESKAPMVATTKTENQTTATPPASQVCQPPEARAQGVLNTIASTIASIDSKPIADVAHAAKNDVTPPILEKVSAGRNSTDEIDGSERESTSTRRLPRPPAIDNVPRMASVVPQS